MEMHATPGHESRRRLIPLQPHAVQDCLILDVVTPHEDDRANGAFGRGNLSHFERRIRAVRWGRYGQLARFADADRRLRHMADGAGSVEMKLQGLAAAR